MLEMQDFEPAGRLAQFMRLVSDCERSLIEEAVEQLIAQLDREDCLLVEDEPDFARLTDGLPGTLEDAEPDDDAKGDPAWTEWHGRAGLRRHYAHEVTGGGGVQDDDEPNGDEQDHDASEDDFVKHEGFGPGCFLADTGIADEDDCDDREDDAPEARAGHAARIQRTRCAMVRHGGTVFYRLRSLSLPPALPGVYRRGRL